jgi:CBS domain-containing protein
MTNRGLDREDVGRVRPGEKAQNISRTMEEENVGSVVVVEDGKPTGIVTDRDLTVQVVGEDVDATAVTAAELMTGDLFTVTEDAGMYGVLSRMSDVGVRRVPVVDHQNDLTGIVTLDDFVVLLSSELEKASEIIQSESPSY